MRLIDTHAHLYSKAFFNDIESVIQRAKEEGVARALLPNVDSESIPLLHQLVEQHPDFCLPMMGLHPCSVKAGYQTELAAVEKNLNERKYIAVGEIGLDYYWDKTFIPEQQDAFITQVKWAKQLSLPIAIHTRDSFEDAIKLLQPLQDGTLRGVFHCFTGSLEDAQKVMDLGFFIGIGGVVTFKNSGLAQVTEKIDLKHLVLETDSPYLAPAPFRGKRNESAYVRLVAEKIALVKNISVEEVTGITTENAGQLFGLADG